MILTSGLYNGDDRETLLCGTVTERGLSIRNILALSIRSRRGPDFGGNAVILRTTRYDYNVLVEFGIEEGRRTPNMIQRPKRPTKKAAPALNMLRV